MKNTFELTPCPCLSLCSKLDQHLWSFFGPIVCLSCIENKDRYNRMVRVFCEVGLCSSVQFYRPKRYKANGTEQDRPGTIGCFNSHKDITSAFKETGVLVFEDDVCFSPNCLDQLADLKKAFEYVKMYKPNFFAFFVGSFPIFPQIPVGPHVARTYGSIGAHALFYSKRACRYISDLEFGNHRGYPLLHMLLGQKANDISRWSKGQIGIDMITGHEENYAFCPMIAFQAGKTDQVTYETTNEKNVIGLQELINPKTAKVLELATLFSPPILILLITVMIYYYLLKTLLLPI